MPHDRLGRRAGRPADASPPVGSDRGGGRAGVGTGLGGDAMTPPRKNHADSIVVAVVLRFAALAVGGWLYEVCHG